MRKPGSISASGLSWLLFVLFDDQPPPSPSRKWEDESLPHLRDIAGAELHRRPFHAEHSLKYSHDMHPMPGDGT